MDDLAAGDFGHEVVVFVRVGSGFFGLSFHHDASAHHALLAEGLGEGTGVNAGDGGDVFPLEPGFQVLFCVPVAVGAAVIGHYQGAGVDVTALEVLFQAAFFLAVRRYAVVADERESGHQNLTGVRGVSQAFRVAGHSRVEHHFSGGVPEASKCGPFVAGAVFQYQGCFHTQKKPVPPTGRTGKL